VNAHIACSPRQTLVFAVRYVLLRRRVDVFLSETKVDRVDDVLLPVGVTSNQKVLGLDVSIDEMFRVDIFYPRDLCNIDHFQLHRCQKAVLRRP